MDKEYITVVIEYKKGEEQPVFHAGMDVLGGRVVGVQFSDALEENEELEERNLYLQQVSLERG